MHILSHISYNDLFVAKYSITRSYVATQMKYTCKNCSLLSQVASNPIVLLV